MIQSNLTSDSERLIGNESIVIQMMESYSGYLSYIQFVAGSNKGKTAVGDVFNSPFALHNVDSTFTSSSVEENGAISASQTASTNNTVAIKWGPVIPGTVTGVLVDDTNHTYQAKFYDDGNGKLYAGVPSSRRVVTEAASAGDTVDGVSVGPEDAQEGRATRVEVVVPAAATQIGTIVYGLAADKAAKVSNGIENIYGTETAALLTFTATSITTAQGATGGTVTLASAAITTDYSYNNIAIPQNDLPILTAKMAAITLQAKARRIAVYYSQMAAFQAKTDYGMNNFQDTIAQQAIGRLAFEIDTEVVELLKKGAGDALASLTWSMTQPVGVSLQEHFAAFARIVEAANATLYRRTLRYRATYMLIAPEILQVLAFVPTFKAVEVNQVNGPYLAGSLGGLKVYVTPSFSKGEFVLGVNGNAMETSAAVYAPYLPICPTQLLGYADGAMSQGFSTLYALELINPALLVKGAVTE